MTQKKDQSGDAIIPDNAFARGIKAATGQDVFHCYQCVKCSAGCPMVHAMDVLPHHVIAKAQVGLQDEVLSSRTIWTCASCLTCSVRCPQKIDIARVMDGLRQLAHARKGMRGDQLIPVFHEAFLHSIRRRGRVYEVGMLMDFKFRARQFFKDIGLGWRMLRKGKLRILPSRVKRMAEIRALFKAFKGV